MTDKAAAPRTLVLLRHAKAERPAGITDFDRPLTGRGHTDAAAAGAWLVHLGHHPDLVICSPARRTRQTWHAVALAMADAGDVARAPAVRYEPAAYGGGSEELLDLVRRAPESAGTVLVIGHNPTVSELSDLLGSAEDRDSDGLRTSGIAVHRGEAPWHEWRQGCAPLVAVHTARG